MKIETYLAGPEGRGWRDQQGWRLSHLDMQNIVMSQAVEGRWSLTGVPCGDDRQPSGERRQIQKNELTSLRFPLAHKPGRNFLHDPEGRARFVDIEISVPPIFRDDETLTKAYAAAAAAGQTEVAKRGPGNMDDFEKWARDRGDKRSQPVLRDIYRNADIPKPRRGAPPKGK
jgi:hypothetical protein